MDWIFDRVGVDSSSLWGKEYQPNNTGDYFGGGQI